MKYSALDKFLDTPEYYIHEVILLSITSCYGKTIAFGVYRMIIQEKNTIKYKIFPQIFAQLNSFHYFCSCHSADCW